MTLMWWRQRAAQLAAGPVDVNCCVGKVCCYPVLTLQIEMKRCWGHWMLHPAVSKTLQRWSSTKEVWSELHSDWNSERHRLQRDYWNYCVSSSNWDFLDSFQKNTVSVWFEVRTWYRYCWTNFCGLCIHPGRPDRVKPFPNLNSLKLFSSGCRLVQSRSRLLSLSDSCP